MIVGRLQLKSIVRITFLVNLDLQSNYALNLLLPTLSDPHDITVFFSSRVGSGAQHAALRQLTFYEQTLPNQLLFPILDRVEKRGSLRTFAGLLEYLTGPIQPLEEPNSKIGLKRLRSARPDLIISIRYGRILHAAAIAVPRLGVINLHSGRLPEYRGVMATFRAMLNNDAELASTLHWIDSDSIDAGPVICQQVTPRVPGSCYLGNVLSLYDAGCSAMVQAIETLSRHQVPKCNAATDTGAYYSFPTDADIARFAQEGHQWVDESRLITFLTRYHPV